MKNVIIVTGGSVNENCLKRLIREVEYDYIIAVDKGIESIDRLSIKPDIVMGDFDSAGRDIVEKYRKMPDITFKEYKKEKDETDTELAVLEASKLSADNVYMIGATGTRIDHVMGNLMLLEYAHNLGMTLVMIDENNRINFYHHDMGDYVIEKRNVFGKYISIIPVSSVLKNLKLSGFLYNLDGIDIKRGPSRTISNEIVYDKAIISMDEGTAFIIESTD